MKKSILRILLIINLILSVSALIRAQNNSQETALIYNNQGVEQTNTGQYEAAVESFNRAISLRPDYATAYFHLGLALYRLKQFEKSGEALHKVIMLNPGHALAHDQLGAVYVELNLLEQALASFKRSSPVLFPRK